MSETIPKVVVDQYRRLEQAQHDLKQAMRSRGIQVGDDETIDTYAAKLTAHEVPRIAIFKVSQFQGFLDERLPSMYVSPSYVNADLSTLFYRCAFLKELTNIEGLERVASMKNFVNEAVALEEWRLPDLPQADNMRELAKSCTGLKKAVVGALPKARTIDYAFGLCSSLETAEIGAAPLVSNVYALFHSCPLLRKVKLSLNGGLIDNCTWMFNDDSLLEEVEGVINLSRCTSTDRFANNCNSLREIRIKGLACDIALHWSTNLSLESVRYLVTNAKRVSGKTIYLSNNLRTLYGAEIEEVGRQATAKGFTINFR
jgi:hypothetical protein